MVLDGRWLGRGAMKEAEDTSWGDGTNSGAGSVKAHRSNTSSGSIAHEVGGYWRGLRRWVGLVEGQGIWKIARGTGLCSEVLDNRLGMVVCPSLMEKRITGIIGLDGVVARRRVCVF